MNISVDTKKGGFEKFTLIHDKIICILEIEVKFLNVIKTIYKNIVHNMYLMVKY